MLNNLNMIGRLTADPELKTTTNGLSVTSFTLAVERSYAQNGERKTDWIPCVAWRNTADFICRYFRKGSMIAIEAELQSRTYENKEGKKVTVLEAVIKNCHFCGGKSETTQNGQPMFDASPSEEDDLPF